MVEKLESRILITWYVLLKWDPALEAKIVHPANNLHYILWYYELPSYSMDSSIIHVKLATSRPIV